MPENKNKISSEEWARRIRATQSGPVRTAPSSIRRTPVNVSGSLAQLKSNLDNLNKQRLGLAMGNVARQYNLADRLAQTTAEISANAIARKDQLYANRQANIDRMSQMYGQYYQQFGNVLNKEALDFLDEHSNINVPTFTAIMAGYEHARASRAEQALAALDRTAKITEAEAQLEEKRVALENEKSASDLLLKTQQMDAQSKANQAAYEAQKAYLDEQAKNEMLGAGLASTGRGTGVRALPGMGGVARGAGGAGGAAGRTPSAVMGARSGETVAGGAASTGRVVRTADGQTVAVDNNKNVMGIVTKDANGQPVVKNESGQTVGSVDTNGNVIPITSEPQAGAYAQYRAAGGGGFWSDPVENTFDYVTNVAGAAGAGVILGELGESARLGYVDPLQRARYTAYNVGRESLSNAANRARDARASLRLAINADPNFEVWRRTFGGGRNAEFRYLDHLRVLQNYGTLAPESQLVLQQSENLTNATRELNNLRNGIRGVQNYNLQSLGGKQGLAATRQAITTADNAGRIARATGAISRFAGKWSGGDLLRRGLRTVAPRIGARAALATATPVGTAVAAGLTAADLVAYGPGLVGGAWEFARQGASNLYHTVFGASDREIANAIATGQPIPERPSAFQAAGEGYRNTQRWFWDTIPGSFTENLGMANREDVNNFSRFFQNITGTNPDYETRKNFDMQPDVVRAAVLNGMLTNRDLKPENLQTFIDDTIRATSTPQEQQAIQQQIQDEKDLAVYEQSRSLVTGDNLLVKAVTEKLQERLAELGYDHSYDDVAMFGKDYTDMVSWIETRNKAGAGNARSSATSMYQINKDFFDTQKRYILDNFSDRLPQQQRDALIKATKASDLDNDRDRPIIQAMVLASLYNNLSVNNEKFDKQGPNIRSDQMAGDIISMMKASYDAGQVDENGNVRNIVIDGNLARLWATNFFRGTDPEAVKGAYNNANNALNGIYGFNRDEQGNNLPWWNGSWITPQRYQEMLGVPASGTQRAGYGFDVAPGVDVDNLNTLLLQRFSAANDAMVSATGVKGQVNSGKRSTAKQTELYNNKDSNPNPVGRPGWSFHQSGMALDFDNDRWEKAFNESNQLKHDYGTFDNFLNAFGLQRGVTGRDGKRTDLVHLTMLQDDEYHANIDHDRLMASRGKWGDEHGNHWMRGVGERPQQVEPAWDVGLQAMVNNFGYPQLVEYPATDYDPNLIFTGNQDGYVFDYDYDEDGNLISY